MTEREGARDGQGTRARNKQGREAGDWSREDKGSLGVCHVCGLSLSIHIKYGYDATVLVLNECVKATRAD